MRLRLKESGDFTRKCLRNWGSEFTSNVLWAVFITVDLTFGPTNGEKDSGKKSCLQGRSFIELICTFAG